MTRHDAELSNLCVAEQHLLNAAVSVRAAGRRLGDDRLWERIRTILGALEETVELTRKTKRIVLEDWRAAEADLPAA